MIRTILAVVLALAIVSLSVPAIDHGATVGTERGLEADLATLETQATELVEEEERPPAGDPGPQRVVTITLPAGSPTAAGVDYVAVGDSLEASTDTDDRPIVTYRLEGGPERIVHVDAPIEPAGEPVVLRGSGDRELRLTLESEAGERVVVVEPW